MDSNTVALAAVTLATTTVAGLIWILKYFANTLTKDIKEHTKAAYDQAAASRESTESSREVLSFMQNLNGELKRAAAAKLSTEPKQ